MKPNVITKYNENMGSVEVIRSDTYIVLKKIGLDGFEYLQSFLLNYACVIVKLFSVNWIIATSFTYSLEKIFPVQL